jgi:hypothetical protein
MGVLHRTPSHEEHARETMILSRTPSLEIPPAGFDRNRNQLRFEEKSAHFTKRGQARDRTFALEGRLAMSMA